ncbi:DUF6520 family protein [Chitinophaga niabensis]|uniref:Uncharacterized protein n=1 Tax=Chitinophaga niabensis TaxID=536979 RepID=A0A1N6KAR1_9BACT|nr:DUF6520 family protein [Chitinophaga niabensis]SIO53640.1 hypothetical protein SAMN04488055_5452 [Chitinophaga niabensis]
MKKRLFLSAVVFILAIGGAFASQLLTADIGYSKLVDVPGQETLCKARIECNGGQFNCTATFDEGLVTYVNIQMYKLAIASDLTSCTIVLTRDTPE